MITWRPGHGGPLAPNPRLRPHHHHTLLSPLAHPQTVMSNYGHFSPPSSLATRSRYENGRPFSPGGSGTRSPKWPLGISISHHEHYIQPVPNYVTEYEDRYRDPRSYEQDIFSRNFRSVRPRGPGSPESPKQKPSDLIGSIFRNKPKLSSEKMTPTSDHQ